MAITYLQLNPNSLLPDISLISPFRSVVVIEEDVSSGWQDLVSAWLVKSGCLYMLAWGKNSSAWHDSIDIANLKEFDYVDIPEDKFVITTWHDDELLRDVFWFSKNLAFHSTIEIRNTLILHISSKNREIELLSEYASV